VRVTQSEWERLKAEKIKLRREIAEAYEAQERARESLNAAFAKEMRLRQQMDLLDKRAEEAIAVEEAGIARQEEEELLNTTSIPEGNLGLSLEPGTWSSLDDLPLSFWEIPFGLPGETAAAGAGSS